MIHRAQSAWSGPTCRVALAAVLWTAASGRSHAAIEAYILSGAAAPDGNGQFSTIRGPILNDAGQLAFFSTMTGTAGGVSSSDRNGVFRRESDGTITQVARGLQTPPGDLHPFTVFSGETPYLNDDGDVAFLASGRAHGIYRGSPLVKIVRPGDAPPEGNGVITSPSLGGFNDAGQIVYSATLTGAAPSTTNQGVYRSDGVTTVKIVRRGDFAPDSTSTFSTLGGAKINEVGEVAFGASTAPGSLSGVYRGDGSTTTLLAQVLNPAPGVGGGTDGTYDTISAPTSINDDGAAAFTAKITAASHGDVTGLFRSDGESAALIFHQGQPAPDAAGGTSGFFASLSSERAIVNNAGQVIAWAGLTGTPGVPTDSPGLFIGDGATIRQVMRNGDLAPDGDGRFQVFGRNSIINEAGQTAFYATHTGSSPLSNGGIYFFDPNGGLTTVARNGQPLLGSTIAALSLAGTNLDTPVNSMETSGLNELGQVAFQFRLTTGAEGVAIWNPPDADFNGDGYVDGDDLAQWQGDFGVNHRSDADNDGDSDGADFLAWQQQLGSGAPLAEASQGVLAPGAPVPEPTASVLAALTLPAMLARYRRRYE